MYTIGGRCSYLTSDLAISELEYLLYTGSALLLIETIFLIVDTLIMCIKHKSLSFKQVNSATIIYSFIALIPLLVGSVLLVISFFPNEPIMFYLLQFPIIAVVIIFEISLIVMRIVINNLKVKDRPEPKEEY